MLQIRVIAPGEYSDRISELLCEDPAVSNVTVYRGASMKPEGDVIEADIAREGANEVIDALRELDIHRFGTIHLGQVPIWISEKGLEAERVTPGASADAVVWAEVTQKAYDDSEFNWIFASFMVLATLLAAIAIVLDSSILLIGAMVLGPEFGAVAALGVALVRRRMTLLGRALLTLVGGFTLSIVATTIAALIARGLGWVTETDVTEARPDTAFIYTPDKWSFIVAVVAGVAGVLSLTSSRLGGLSGVFISVTTIPAAGNVALGLAFGLREEIVGSSLQLVVNLSGMAVAGWMTLAVQQVIWTRVSAYRARLLAGREPGHRWQREP
ncbi:DUF389 domain-containing protein [Nocardia sp. 348MFTsu5.1]|uniref:DUF389 domain-containing protein n=1 Tax=Nocardia sp. 348MFTsu5.1 TaxID=1172185 RepID=UPI0003A0A8DB|nr:DUF389 domain-containing protein [Nocardia sp. 348MFTsu5.1]